METKHTPGPWGISSQSPRIVKQYDSLGETSVILASASSYPQSGFFPSDELALANARLISAAPDLLEAMQTLLDCFVDDPFSWMNNQSEAIEKARDAVIKATGE